MTARNERPTLTLWGVVLDAPDANELAMFYQRLLGWPREQDEPGWVKLRSPEGATGLSFQTDDGYARPVWPTSTAADQRMMVHLDIRVADLGAAGEFALSIGAVRADYQPQEGCTVFFDPAGHPFCLFEN